MDTETNESLPEVDFDSFVDGMFDDSGNQTETEDVQETTETEEETTQDGESKPETGENSEGENTEEEEKDPAESEQEPESKESDQMFTIKVNKEEKTLSRDEVITYAQKGADYDRVRAQRDEREQEVATLRNEISTFKPAQERLSQLAERAGLTPDELMDNLDINLRKSKGMDEAAARESMRADKLQRELDAAKNQKQTDPEDAALERYNKEKEEFLKVYPDLDPAEIPEETVQAIKADIQSGVSLVNAYQKHENAALKSELATVKAQLQEAQTKLQAAQQNRKNKAASTGSQSDSGGAAKHDIFDDFMKSI